MKLEEIEKIKQKLKNNNFGDNYAGLKKLGFVFSIIANFLSILFAYFYASDLILSAFVEITPTAEVVSIVGSLIFLALLEILKRFIFDKFSKIFIKDKYKFNDSETKILGSIGVVLIFVSFYASTNGIEKWSDKRDEIASKADAEINAFSDTLSKKYDSDIRYLDSLNKELLITKQTYEKQIDESLDKKEINDFNKKLRKKEKEIALNDSKIKEMKSEKDKEISKFEDKKKEVSSKQIESNGKSPKMFFIVGSVIELLILVGIWFSNYYNYRVLFEFESETSKNPSYKNFKLYNTFLDMIYKEDSKVNDIVPFKTELTKLMKSSKIDISPKELDEIQRVLVHLNVLKTKGNRKVLAVLKEEAFETVKTHFNIN